MMAAFVPELAQDLILGGTVFVVGVMVYLAVRRNIPSALEQGDWTPVIRSRSPLIFSPSVKQLGYANARLGVSLLLLLIAELVFRVPELPITPQVVLYIIGLVMTGTGYFIVAFGHGDADDEKDDHVMSEPRDDEP